jgi:hypothetical protein
MSNAMTSQIPRLPHCQKYGPVNVKDSNYPRLAPVITADADTGNGKKIDTCPSERAKATRFGLDYQGYVTIAP